ncbi:MAG TPA: calcium/sodium antiporter [Acidobacteriota bacterium]|nr:calcium/sodium antiporter [Acidobacteriota bacterium]
MIVSVFILVIAFVALIKGADWLVDGSANLAKRFGVSPLVIGLTVVAFGTSMPELIVNIFAALAGQGGVTYGNIVGSNIVNILLILGVSALISPVLVQKSTRNLEIPLSIIAAVALLVVSLDGMFSMFDGILLLLFFIGFLWYISYLVKNHSIEPEVDYHSMSVLKCVLLMLVGLTLLVVGGKFVVSSAVDIARGFGLSEFIIGATIVAIGTSLPELVTSIVAAIKKNAEIAVGNIVGSNIFNILFIMGVSGVVRGFAAPAGVLLDIAILIGISVVLLLCSIPLRFGRRVGILFVLLYAAYIYSIFMR